MTNKNHGPGVEWLAAKAGVTPDAMLHDGSLLGRALEGAARDAVDLARRLTSADPATRQRAEAEARAVRARLATSSGGETPEARFRRRVAEALANGGRP